MSRKVTLVLGGVGLLVLVILCWFIVLSPLRNDIAKTRDQIQTESAKLAGEKAKLARAEATRKEGEKNQARLLELMKMVPAEDEIPSLIIQIHDLARRAGIKFITISPGTPIQAGAFSIVPISLEFEGLYYDLSDFLYRAESLVGGPGRLIAIKEISLQLAQAGESTSSTTTTTAVSLPGGSISPRLKIDMTMYAFTARPTTSSARGQQ